MALETFDASVRLGSFSRAAEVLNLTPGAVSRQMAALGCVDEISTDDVFAIPLRNRA